MSRFCSMECTPPATVRLAQHACCTGAHTETCRFPLRTPGKVYPLHPREKGCPNAGMRRPYGAFMISAAPPLSRVLGQQPVCLQPPQGTVAMQPPTCCSLEGSGAREQGRSKEGPVRSFRKSCPTTAVVQAACSQVCPPPRSCFLGPPFVCMLEEGPALPIQGQT